MSHAKITNQTDLVAHLISALGFTPASSVALQLLEGEKAFASLRVDVASPGDTTAWAHQVTGIVQRLEQVTGVSLVSFEDDKAMTAGQYEELGDQLAHIGAPIRRAVLVSNGMVMDYEGDGTDAEDWDTVQISPVGLEAHFARTKPAMRMADIPAYDDRLDHEAEELAGDLQGFDFDVSENRERLRAEFTGLVTEYQAHGRVTDPMVIWVAGAMRQKSTRDLVAVVTATADMSLESITNVLLGETIVEDREFFDHAVEMLYRCAHYVNGEPFANILCLLGWACWMTGQGSEAQKFLLRAGDECPGHRLSELLTLLVTQGKVPATALVDPNN
ncbi:DUF4192 family protein [Glutamicibacter bergerei]|uniref:DUF4192 family protein n=1 Tax=Glutamicibacter bergerei TaxID=256702 RepID=A0ABV9MS62_9MICC|nr:hypothetical protein [Micrococcaceae bacterium]